MPQERRKYEIWRNGRNSTRKRKRIIVLINSGGFYLARGKDAIQLNKILKLKLTCMEKEICKVGFPINALEKYNGEFYNTEENCKKRL